MKKFRSILIIVICAVLSFGVFPHFVKAKENEYSMEACEVVLSYTSEEEFLGVMELVCENENFAFYIDNTSLAVALKDKRNSKVFFSNPYDAASDPFYTETLKARLNSQLTIDYIDISGNIAGQLFSSDDCVQKGQFCTEVKENGIDVKMTLGEIKEEMLIPPAMSEESFEKFTSKMDDFAAGSMEIFYEYVELSELEEGLEKQELIKNFPAIKKQNLYVLSEINSREEELISGYLKDAGYTEKDYKKDMELGSSKTESEAVPNFELKIEYRLTEEGITVTVPKKSVKYNKKDFALTGITLLEFFAADKPIENGEGYLFIPDGSGAIIDIDDTNQKRRRTISGEIYGRDMSVKSTEETEGEDFRLPVFGIYKNNGSTLFAEIVSGDEISTVTAALGEPSTNYFRTYNTFRYTPYDKVVMNTKVGSQNSAIITYSVSEDPFAKDLSVKYSPLLTEKESYVEMAKHYRKSLIKQGSEEKAENTVLNTEIELLGTAVGKGTFLGFTVDEDYVFTDYDSALKLSEWFQKNGADNLRIVYTGWQKNGLNAGAIGKQKPSSVLGSKSGWKKLHKELDKKSIELVPSSDMLFSSYQYMFDGYSVTSDTAKNYNDAYTGVYKFRNKKDEKTLNYLISPAKYEKLWKKYFKGTNKLYTNSFMLQNVGVYLASDASRDGKADRTASINAMDKVFTDYAKGKSLWFTGGNKYVLKYAAGVSDTVLNHSDFAGETAGVPFYQLATDGLIKRSSKSINLAKDWEDELLCCVQTHTSPKFTLAYENTSLLKNTDFTSYYSVDYNILREKIAEDVKRMSEELSCIDGEYITDFRIISNGVTVTEYSNGSKVLVNKTEQPIEFEGITVSAKDYKVIN